MTDPDAAAADAAGSGGAAADAAAAGTAPAGAAPAGTAGPDPNFDAVQAALKDLDDDDGEEFEEPGDLTEEQRKQFVEKFGE